MNVVPKMQNHKALKSKTKSAINVYRNTTFEDFWEIDGS